LSHIPDTQSGCWWCVKSSTLDEIKLGNNQFISGVSPYNTSQFYKSRVK